MAPPRYRDLSGNIGYSPGIGPNFRFDTQEDINEREGVMVNLAQLEEQQANAAADAAIVRMREERNLIRQRREEAERRLFEMQNEAARSMQAELERLRRNALELDRMPFDRPPHTLNIPPRTIAPIAESDESTDSLEYLLSVFPDLGINERQPPSPQ